jgi:hypothetical protein
MDTSRKLSITNGVGLGVTAADNGHFELSASPADWRFTGHAPGRVVDLNSRSDQDQVGLYQEIVLDCVVEGARRRCAIRLYEGRDVALFEITYVDPGDIRECFPIVSVYPRDLRRLAYTSGFGGFSFERAGTDGPWVFFDGDANTFILSPASNFMNARLSVGADDELRSGLVATVRKIPAGFVHATAVAVTPGVNRCFESWGRFLTDLAGKERPANDADVGLKYFGYWTDRGARYYYGAEPGLDYPSTLLAVRDEFHRAKLPLGYMQIDSWFYPKGRTGQWRSQDRLGGGVYLYEASEDVFPQGLGTFQTQLGLPLVTHNRWIDADSPYRNSYAMSGNVSIDPALWDKWMRDLKATGVRIYEQDWLSGPAHAERDLAAGEQFMGLMAEAARAQDLTLQYCMPLPRHFLQGSKYSNLTTIRTSADRFGRNRWKAFLFNGRLATALGVWPWTDVFMSSETSNLLIATLSGGMVGVGDPIGTLDSANLMRAIRADGVIVKPDHPLTPLDAAYVAQAKDSRSPVISAARTEHASWIASYVFTFRSSRGARTASLQARDLGYVGPVYAYDYFGKRGARFDPADEMRQSIPDEGAYWIVVPIGASGTAFLGDPDKFVGAGRQRVASVSDDGVLRARLTLSDGETRVRLHGFSAARPLITAARQTIEDFTYDAESGLFEVALTRQFPGALDVEIASPSS